MEGEINRDGAMRGVRVLDLTRVLSGPYCTMMLADQGAEVVKIEIPEKGDDARHVGPPLRNGESAFFISTNRNKKSFTLNLKSEEGIALLKRLVAKADVFVENYRPGVTEKLGIDYATLSQVNPRLVYCSISGFGQTGPYRSRPGYNFTVQALSGVMTVSGEPGSKPYPAGISLGDIPSGMFAAFAIAAALFQRGSTGVGTYIDISMLDSLVALMEYPLARFGMTRECPPPIGQYNPSITPFGILDTADTPIVIAAGNDKLWQTLCQAIARGDLLDDPRYVTNPLRTENRDVLYGELTETLRTRRAEEWLEILVNAGVPAARVNTVADLFHDPQIAARGMVQVVRQPKAGEVAVAGSPVRLGMNTSPAFRPAPQLAEHVNEICHDWLAMSEQDLAALRDSNVI